MLNFPRNPTNQPLPILTYTFLAVDVPLAVQRVCRIYYHPVLRSLAFVPEYSSKSYQPTVAHAEYS
jgi:hypothetical protein